MLIPTIYVYITYTKSTGVRLFKKLEQVFYYKELKKRTNAIIKNKKTYVHVAYRTTVLKKIPLKRPLKI